jgi:transposase InsO family protein
MSQIARNATMEGWGFLTAFRALLHDRDTKFCSAFRETLRSGGVRALRLPARSPNLNAFAERWVRSVKEECLDRLVIFGERALRQVLDEYVAHYHHERNHQGLDNRIIEPTTADHASTTVGTVRRRTRLGGLLSFYHRAAG